MIEQLYETYLRTRTVTTDSRAITPGCLFFAFRGEHFDGNAFAPQALEQGAALCVIDDERYKVDERCIVVDDVLATLQALARHHRRQLTIPVVGITGTNGKTTTKELVHAVLARRYRTSATRGNLNNHLGVPLTLLAIPPDAELAIVEMGANHPGEIEFLCSIADPDCGLITNVGRAHLEGFGSFEGVVHTKTELYRHLAAKGGSVFVNADNAILMEQAAALRPPTSGLRLHSYGLGAGADVHGSHVADTPFMKFYFEVGDNVYTVQSHLLGAYNFDNCMAAVAVGLHFGVDPFDIKEAIEAYTPSNQRSEYRETPRGNRLYLDCYNANPSSMAAAIESFHRLVESKRQPAANRQLPAANCQLSTANCQLSTAMAMAILGGMHELGAEERKEHERVVEQAAACRLDRVLLVGPEWAPLPLPDNMLLFPDTEAARGWLAEHPVEGATILVKGSNTNRLWTLVDML